MKYSKFDTFEFFCGVRLDESEYKDLRRLAIMTAIENRRKWDSIALTHNVKPFSSGVRLGIILDEMRGKFCPRTQILKKLNGLKNKN